jgi:hypothetical protein
MAREPALHRNIRFSLVAKLRWGTRLFVAGVCDPGTGLIETGYSQLQPETRLPQCRGRGLFPGMSTLQEIEEAVATLPEQEQKELFRYLENRLASKHPRKRMLPLVPSIGQPITQQEIDDALEAE